jgi:hypothetical protein
LAANKRARRVASWPRRDRVAGALELVPDVCYHALMLGRVLLFTLATVTLACSASDPASGEAPGAAGAAGGAAGAAGSGGSNAAGSAGASGGSAGNAGSGGDSGSSGSGGAGSGGSAGSAGTGGSATAPLFFDDFESGSVDAAKWTERLNGTGTIVVDGAQKHGGASALHVTSSGFSLMLAAEGAPIFPAPDNTFYGRVWLYVPGALPVGSHVVWIEAGDVDNDQHEVRIGMNLNALQVNLWQNGEVDLRAPSAPLQAATWHCVEFKMGNDELEVWLDSTRVDELSTTDWVASNPENGNTSAKTGWSPTYEALRIGWELAGAEIFYDDVALDHSRIGCD